VGYIYNIYKWKYDYSQMQGCDVEKVITTLIDESPRFKEEGANSKIEAIETLKLLYSVQDTTTTFQIC